MEVNTLGTLFSSLVNQGWYTPFSRAHWNEECRQTQWGQGLHHRRNRNIVINTVAAQCDRSVIFIKDALLILWVLLPAPVSSLPFLTLSWASFQQAELIIAFRSKATWFSKVNIMTRKLHHLQCLYYQSIALHCQSLTPSGNQHEAMGIWICQKLWQLELFKYKKP